VSKFNAQRACRAFVLSADFVVAEESIVQELCELVAPSVTARFVLLYIFGDCIGVNEGATAFVLSTGETCLLSRLQAILRQHSADHQFPIQSIVLDCHYSRGWTAPIRSAERFVATQP
jgi:hypothetical protein